MKGHLERSKGIKDISYVNLRPAGDANMKMWEAKLDELLDELKNLFARCWNPGDVGTLVNRIHDKVHRALIWEREHLFQTFCQDTVTRLFVARVVGQIKT